MSTKREARSDATSARRWHGEVNLQAVAIPVVDLDHAKEPCQIHTVRRRADTNCAANDGVGVVPSAPPRSGRSIRLAASFTVAAR
jgi:hypothetical protein